MVMEMSSWGFLSPPLYSNSNLDFFHLFILRSFYCNTFPYNPQMVVNFNCLFIFFLLFLSYLPSSQFDLLILTLTGGILEM